MVTAAHETSLEPSTTSAPGRVLVIVDVRLVRVLAIRVLVGSVSVLKRRVIVLMRVGGCEVLHLSSRAALGVVGYVHMLVVVDHRIVTVALKPCCCHDWSPPSYTRLQPKAVSSRVNDQVYLPLW